MLLTAIVGTGVICNYVHYHSIGGTGQRAVRNCEEEAINDISGEPGEPVAQLDADVIDVIINNSILI